MAKSDVVKEIVGITNSYTEKELLSKTEKELKAILDDLNSKAVEEMKAPIDLEEMKAQMYQEIMEQVKKDLTNEKKEEIVMKTPTLEPKIKRKESLDKQMLVPIMNVTNGKLIYQSKRSGSEFQFEKYGDIEYIEVYELLTMRSSQRRFLDEPYVIVLDDEVAEYLGLSNNYKKLTHATEISRIFDLPLERYKEVVQSAPKGLAHLIVSTAKEKLANGELDSVQKVQALEEVYNVELSN